MTVGSSVIKSPIAKILVPVVKKWSERFSLDRSLHFHLTLDHLDLRSGSYVENIVTGDDADDPTILLDQQSRRLFEILPCAADIDRFIYDRK